MLSLELDPVHLILMSHNVLIAFDILEPYIFSCHRLKTVALSVTRKI